MSDVVIGDILPYTQAIAMASQTVFNANWTANDASDVVVYQTPSGDQPDDAIQILAYPATYSVSFVGSQQDVQITLVTAANAGDIITITRQTPADFLNLYSNTNFTPSMLNNDFSILTLVDQQAQLVNQLVAPRYNYSAEIAPNSMFPNANIILPILGDNETWVMNSDSSGIITYILPAGGIAPANDTYILLTPDSANLPNSFALNTLSSGYLVFNSGGTTILSNTFTGQSNQIGVTNGSGVGGATNIYIVSNPIISGTAGMGIPQGSTAQRVTPGSNISLRYNTDIKVIEYYNGTGWSELSQDSNINPGSINQLAYYASSGSDVSGLATANNGVLITSSGGVPSISSTLPNVVQSNITALGTVVTGVWNGTIFGLNYGGTNANLTANAGSIAYSTASAIAFTAAGTTGQLLQSAGTGTPTWTDSIVLTSLAVTGNSLFGTDISTTGFGNVQNAAFSSSSMISSLCYSATSGQTGQFISAHSISTAVGVFSALSMNDAMGSWQSYGDDGTQFTVAAQIDTAVDKSVSTGVVPGRIEFRTSNSSGILTRALTIDSNQVLKADSEIMSASQVTATSFSPTTTSGIIGTTTNDDAASGSVGEYIISDVQFGSPVSLTTGISANVTSISLTSGDWKIEGLIGFNIDPTSVVLYTQGGASTVSDTLPSNNNYTFYITPAVPVTPAFIGLQTLIPVQRISIATPTIIYLVAVSTFSIGTVSAYGYISATRTR